MTERGSWVPALGCCPRARFQGHGSRAMGWATPFQSFAVKYNQSATYARKETASRSPRCAGCLHAYMIFALLKSLRRRGGEGMEGALL